MFRPRELRSSWAAFTQGNECAPDDIAARGSESFGSSLILNAALAFRR
jgi:hypothetical protein